jgi:hypothetical protein
MGNYLRSLADRMAGASRLRPRVRSLFEPSRGSEGLLAPGWAAPVPAPDAAMPRDPAPLETEATVDAAPYAPDVAGAGVPRRRAGGSEDPAAAGPAPEPSKGLLRHAAPLRLSQLPHAALPERQAVAPAAEGNPLSHSAAADVESTRAPPQSAAPLRGALVPAEASPRTTLLRRETATAPVPESQPHGGETARRQADRQRPAEDGAARKAADLPWPDVAAARVQPQAPRREPSVAAVEAALSIQVVIGKITVQADTPSAPARIAVRAVAPAGPRLSLEQYLLQRGGRG